MIDAVLEWVGRSPVNQMIVGGAAIIVLLLIILLVRRSRKRKPVAGKVEAADRLRAARSDPKEVFEGYRESHPAFYKVISQIQAEQSLDNLMSNTEFAGAVAKLKLWQTVRGGKTGKPSNKGPLSIQAGRADSNAEVRGAMITILRIIYSSPEISGKLSPKTESELDALLESLTG
ncbi:MAG TPA: hypothetical protein PLP42_01020 [Acidobacteriota bacterium]|nr:hypothetical protein [Acidobacteriota bacterium]